MSVRGAGAHDMIPHQCVADHCVACCPVARSYSEGYEQARSFYLDFTPVDHGDSGRVLFTLALLFAVVVLTVRLNKLEERLASEDPA